MPCNLNLYSYLEELKFICSSLGKKQSEVSAITTEFPQSEEDLWSLNEDVVDEKEKGWNPQTNWINSCFSSISPFSDVLVLSNSNRTFFLTSKFTKTEENLESQKFLVAADKFLTSENGEEVTCVFCLPVFYQRKSQHSSPDWTCVFVGFSTGIARMYTECGELLFSQQFFDTPIHNIHYEMYNSMEYAGDLLIQDDHKIVAIEGFILIQTLKACRNQLARAKAGQGDIAQPPPMLYKRWSFPETKNFQSCSFVGNKSLSMFDYLLSETMHGGPSVYPQTSAPVLNSALTTGGDLFLGFHNISDAAGPQALSDVAVAFASKLKTMLTPSIGSKLVTGLWNNNEEKLENQSVTSEAFTAVPLRFGFFDKTKQGSKIYLSPDRTLAAVTDNHNRVLVIDVNRGLCVRIFKGYRDAQCGWMRSDEADDSDTPKDKTIGARRVHYLVIYSPKRGILEVWLAPKGHKVAAFNVNRMGKLFYPGLCVLGLNGLQQQQLRNISNKIGSLIPCCLLEPNGKLTAISTSFKDALKKPLDTHSYDNSLFEDLQKNISSFQADFDDKCFEEIKSNLLEIESYEFLKKAIHLLILSFASKLHCKDSFLQCVQVIIDDFNSKDDLNDDAIKILLSCKKIIQLSETHKVILKINHEASREAPDQDFKLPPDLQTLVTVFSVTEREAADVISALSMHSEITMNRQSKRKRVSFVEEFDTDSLGFFLDQFKLFDQDPKHKMDEDDPIPLHFDEHKLDSVFLGQLLFDTAIKNSAFSENIISALDSSGISGLDLIKLLLSHWLSGSVQPQHWKHWINLHQLLKFCFNKINQDDEDDSEVLSPTDNNNKNLDIWKEDIITMLSESSNLEASYVATWLFRALICNDHAVKENLAKKLEAGDESDNSNGSKSDIKEWETLTEESVAWKILTNRLEDLLVLDALLKSRESLQTVEVTSTANVRISEPSYGCCHPISVSDILQRGQGAISEVIAEWAVFNDLPPNFFQTDVTARYPHSDEPDNKERNFVSDGIKLSPVKDLLKKVRKRFPRSCDSDAIIANTSWEYFLSWNKKPDKIEKLKYAKRHLHAIRSSSLRNGVARLMWKTIFPRFVALAQLIDKVGKTPKDRLCKQDLFMSSNHIEPFLEICCSFLIYFLEDKIGRTEEEESLTPYPPDELWRQTIPEKPKTVRRRTYSGGNKPGLVERASDMDPSHYGSVDYHLSLARSLLFIVTFELKNTRPLTNFFEKESRCLLFGELNKEIQLGSALPSTAIIYARTEFLKRVAAGIVNRIPDILPPNSKTSSLGSMTPNVSTPNQNPQLEASKWINLVMTQAKLWGVNSDDIMSHYVCELYSAGHDGLAEEAMGFIDNTRSLASKLLVLSGQRLSKIVQTSKDTTVKLADLPPRLSSWMNTLNSGLLKNSSSNLESTKTLIGHVVSFIEDEKSTEYKLSLELFEAINNLT